MTDDTGGRDEAGGAGGTGRRGVMPWVLLGILLVAFGLRLWGCFGQGLPYSYYPDEQQNVARALRLGAERTLNPRWFNKPALGYYVLLAEYGAYYGAGRLFGTFESARDFGLSYFEDQTPFLLIGRISNTLFGVLTVLLTYFLGRRFGGRHAGLLAALALALSAGHIASCQEVKMDVPATFWSTWSVLVMLAVMNRGRWRDYILAGGLAGIGMATKYYTLPLLGSLFFVHLFRTAEARALSPRVWLSPRYAAGVAAFVAGFFVGSPYNFLSRQWWDERFRPVVEFVLNRMQMWFCDSLNLVSVVQEDGAQAAVRGPLVDPYRDTLWDSFAHMWGNFSSSVGVSLVLALLTVVGVVVLVARRHRLASFLLVTLAILTITFALANQQFPEPRHLNTLYPLTAVAVAVGVVGLLRPLRLRPLALLSAGVVLLVLPLPGFPLLTVVSANLEHMEEDPRNRVLAWMEENIPADSVIINDHGKIHLRPSEARVDWVFKRVHKLRKQALSRLEQLSAAGGSRERRFQLEKHAAFAATYKVQWEYRRDAGRAYKGPRFDTIDLNHPWMTESLMKRRLLASGYNPIFPRSPWGHFLNKVVNEAASAGTRISGPEARRRFLKKLEEYFRARPRRSVLRRAQRRGETLEGRALEQATERELQSEMKRLYGIDYPAEPVPPVDLWRTRTSVSSSWLARRTEQNGRVILAPVQWMVSGKGLSDNFMSQSKIANFPDFAEFYADLKAHFLCYEFNSDDPDHKRVIRIWDLRTRLEKGKVIRVP